MATVKVSITLDADVLRLARERAGSGLSAYVNEALLRRVKNEALDEALDDWEQEFGPIPAETMAEMQALWPRD